MGRIIEFMKESEARIILFVLQADAQFKTASFMSVKLRIDYTYLMRLLNQMYDKGWISTRVHQKITYFDVVPTAPIKEAKERLSPAQQELIKQ